MTDSVVRRPGEVPWWAGVSAVVGPVALAGAWMYAVVAQSGGDEAAGRLTTGSPLQGWWITPAAVVLAGITYIVTAAGLRPAATTGRWLLAIGGVLVVVATGMSMVERTGFLYQDLANVAMVTLCVWPAGITPDDRPLPLVLHRGFGEALAVGLTALLVLYVVTRTNSTSTSTSYGLPQRSVLLAQSLAPLAVLLGLRFRPTGEHRAPRPSVAS